MDDQPPPNVRPIRPERREPTPAAQRWIRRFLVAIVVVVVAAVSLLGFYVDLLWFEELGQRDVLVTRVQWAAAMGLGTGLVAFAVLQVNFVIARRVARGDLYVPFLEADADPEAPDQPTVPEWAMRPILLGVAVLGGVITGLVMGGNWEVVLRWLGRSDFGVVDPHFGKDASFYVFTMPLLELVVQFVQVLTVLAALASAAAYVAMGVVRYVPRPRIARPAILHVSLLAAIFLLVSAVQYRLAIWNLVTSEAGAATGVGWTDDHAREPGFWVMVVASVVLAGVVAWFARRERWRLVGGAFIGWIVLSVIVTGVIPSVVQGVLVNPNELEREEEVIEGNIALTRAGFDLDEVRTEQFTDEANLTPADLRANEATTANLRIWSPDVLRRALDQLQLFRSYYVFNDVDVDRYVIDGRLRQVMLAVRELDTSALPTQSWTSERLQFTHGYGVAAVWPNQATDRGRPVFAIQDIPPVSLQDQAADAAEAGVIEGVADTTEADAEELAELEGTEGAGGTELEGAPEIVPAGDEPDVAGALPTLGQPQIYYGERTTDFVVVDTELEEFDYPEGDANATNTYDGEGGIAVSNLFRRFAFAVTQRDSRLLVTGQLNADSKVLMRRTVRERVETLAPFLKLDGDPYAVLDDGGITWIQDAYTTSDRFPYSDPSLLRDGSRISYVRNSVKVTVDAFDGTTTLYVVDEDDPVLGAWREIFPDLFTPLDEMPEQLQAHVRYPEDLFSLQTDKWLTYHVTNPRTFFLGEDLWQLPELGGQPQEAYYVLATLPGESRAELLLIRPVTPANRKNLIGYMAARMDGDKYGQVLTFTLPKQSLTQGPQQVQSLIQQEPEVAEQLRLWDRGQNQPVFGNLLVLPIENSLLYVQPVYLENSEAQIPEFQRIVVALGEDIAWGDTFSEAVDALYEKRGDGQARPGGPGDDGADAGEQDVDDAEGGDEGEDLPDTGTGAFADLPAEDARALLAELDQRYERAQQCQRDGDWSCYGEEVEAIDELLASAGGGGEA